MRVMRQAKYRAWARIAVVATLVAMSLLLASLRHFVAVDHVSGPAELIDGDSFFVRGHEVRLEGIDAPEGRQTCRLGGRDWPCGEVARRELRRLIAGRPVECAVHSTDRFGRLLATCKAGGDALNSGMVSAGHAVAFGRFEAEERAARNEQRGLWAGEFERPSEWRRKNAARR